MINLLTQYRKSARQIISLNPEMISWIEPLEKDDGFGGKIPILDSAEAEKTAQIRFVKHENILELKESSIGFSDPAGLYILMYWFISLSEGLIIKKIKSGEKYRVNQIEDLEVSGGVWMRRAKVEKVG